MAVVPQRLYPSPRGRFYAACFDLLVIFATVAARQILARRWRGQSLKKFLNGVWLSAVYRVVCVIETWPSQS
jgi:hypothetical protein